MRYHVVGANLSEPHMYIREVQWQWVRVRVSYRFRAIDSPVMPSRKIVYAVFAQASVFMRVM